MQTTPMMTVNGMLVSSIHNGHAQVFRMTVPEAELDDQLLKIRLDGEFLELAKKVTYPKRAELQNDMECSLKRTTIFEGGPESKKLDGPVKYRGPIQIMYRLYISVEFPVKRTLELKPLQVLIGQS